MQPRIAQMLGGDHQTASPAWRWFGIRLVAAEPGRTVCEMAVTEDMRNHQGVCHGGCLSTLADSAMGAALATVLPEGERHMSFDLKLTFLKPVLVGQAVRATGSVVHNGRRTAVGEARLEVEGTLVATASASFIVYLPEQNS
jgi:uncharacterized protein (TIGR00369 family)